MFIKQEEDFFPNLNILLPEIYKIPIYTNEEYKKLTDNPSEWPGKRSAPFHESNMLLNYIIMDLLERKNLIDNQRDYEVFNCLHLRTQESNDWIHQDSDNLAALIYLNKTNLNSGTKMYNPEGQMINDIKYVQNRCIMFDAKYYHSGYGHFGTDIYNGRLTINCFLKRIR